MLRSIIQAQEKHFAHDPAARGYHAVYRDNEVNHCPACGRTQWYVGRLTAECGFCATALPLAEVTISSALHYGPRRADWASAA